MSSRPTPALVCEVLSRSTAKENDILFEDCRHYHMMLLDSLTENPRPLQRRKEKKTPAVSA